MKSSVSLKLSTLVLVLFELTALTTPAFARGGGHAWYDPDEFKTVRDEHAWNGDSYMSDYEKASLYKNCKLQNGMRVTSNGSIYNNSGQTVSYRSGNLLDGQGGNNQTNGSTYNSSDYSGPAYIGPANYNSVVQTYKWATPPTSTLASKPRQQSFGNSTVEAARRLGH